MKVKVLRAFCIRGERQEPGKEIDVADAFGRELVFAGRAAPANAQAAAKAKPGPMTTKTAAALTGAAPVQQEI